MKKVVLRRKKKRVQAPASRSTIGERVIKRKSALFLAPSFLGVLLFFVLPFGVVGFYSMVNNPVQHKFVFLDNFIYVGKNAAFRLAAANTLKFSLVAVPLVVVLSMMMAFALEQAIPWKSRFRTLLLSPMMVPIASVVLIWKVLFHYNGVVNEFVQLLGGGKIDWFKSDYAQIILVLLFIWKNLGYNMILFIAAISNVPKEIIEVAQLESAKGWQIFFFIKLRYLSSTILFVTILSLINSFKVFREVYMLTGDYPYDSLYLLQHFMNNTFRSLDYQKLSAAAIIMCLFMIVIIGILFMTENYFGKDMEDA
ncbi:MAG: sugar ABC transporter permease [Lachnospiraceae bacterium]|nr:sugar ABC transporter permease [Lachnospiraceae bacterium]